MLILRAIAGIGAVVVRMTDTSGTVTGSLVSVFGRVATGEMDLS